MYKFKKISIVVILSIITIFNFSSSLKVEAQYPVYLQNTNTGNNKVSNSFISSATKATLSQKAKAAKEAQTQKDNRAKEALKQVVMRPPWDNGEVYDSVQVLDENGVNENIRQMSRDSMDKKLVYINLTKQQFTALEDGNIVRQSSVTTGKNKFPTIQGEFQIWDKKYKYTLKAPSPEYGKYVLPVDYWMPFHKGYGMHDAPWRSVFGKSDYTYNGSHGCINMQNQDSRWLFEWSNIGTVVFISK